MSFLVDFNSSSDIRRPLRDICSLIDIIVHPIEIISRVRCVSLSIIVSHSLASRRSPYLRALHIPPLLLLLLLHSPP